MFPSPASRTRVRIILILALGVATAALPFWLRASIAGGHEAGARQRRGRAAMSVTAPRFVEHTLVDRLRAAPDVGSAFEDAAALIAVDGVAASTDGSVQVPRVAVYGVDDRFWRLHRVAGIAGPSGDDLLANDALRTALGLAPGSPVTVAIERGEDAPRGTVHGRRDADERAITLRLSPASLGDASRLSPLASDDNRPAAFVPLARLQEDPEWHDRVNAILLSTGPDDNPRVNGATIETAVAHHATLADYGLRLRIVNGLDAILLESRTGLLADAVVDAATRTALDVGGLPSPVMTTLVQSMRHGDRSVPLSFVTSIELQMVAPDVHAEELDRPPIVLNDWTARQLGAVAGDVVSLDVPVWHDAGRLTTESAPFQVAGILPMASPALQPVLTPALPGITGRPALRDWTPRVPVDLSRVRPVDEEYWTQFGATPKAFVPPQVARALWRTGHGSASAVFITPAQGVTLAETARQFDDRLRERIAPSITGLVVRDLAADARLRSEAAGRRVSRWAWWVVPFVLAAVLAALIWCAAAPITRGQARGVAASGALAGLLASPLAAALCQLAWSGTVGDPEIPGRFAVSLADATTPLLVSVVTGLGAALLLTWTPSRLSRHGARASAVGVVALAVLAAAVMAWMSPRAYRADHAAVRSPSGGYTWFVRTTFPLMLDPSTAEGQAALGLSGMADVRVTPFRVLDGANAIRQHPIGPSGLRVAAVTQTFIDEGRFAFLASLDRTDEERANPWLLLRREQRDRSGSADESATPIVPVITSARTLAALQRDIGDDLALSVAGRAVRFRVVATLDDAVFDDALVMADGPFLSWFPDATGYHWLAVEALRDRADNVRAAVVTALATRGGSVEDAGDAARRSGDRAAAGLRIANALFAAAGLLALSALRSARWLRP